MMWGMSGTTSHFLSGGNETGGYATPVSAYEAHTDYIRYREARPNIDRLQHANAYIATAGDEINAIFTLAHLEEHYKLSENFHHASRTFVDELVKRADTVFLSDALHELVDKSSQTMPDEILFATDVYTPCAMVFLERPIYVTASEVCLAEEVDNIISKFVEGGGVTRGERKYYANEKRMCEATTTYAVRAIMWADAGSLNPYAIDAMRAKYGQEAVDAFHEVTDALVVMTYGVIVSSTVDGVELITTDTKIEKSLNQLMMVDKFVFAYGEDGYNREAKEIVTLRGVNSYASGIERVTRTRRFVVALLRLMSEYVDIDTERVPRPHAKRGIRAKRLNTETVTTLSLRRSVYDTDGTAVGHKIMLAHLVRGHWRNQWYPSQQTHRARWINAHRRGGTPTDEVKEKRRLVKVDK